MYGIYGWWIFRFDIEEGRTNSRTYPRYNHICCKLNHFYYFNTDGSHWINYRIITLFLTNYTCAL